MINILKSPILTFLKKPSTILIVHILFTALQLGSATIYGEKGTVFLARIGGFLLYSVFTYLALKKNKIALWIMAISIFVPGVLGFITGVFFVSISQYLIKPLFIIISAYFIFGGIILLPLKKNSATKDEYKCKGARSQHLTFGKKEC